MDGFPALFNQEYIDYLVELGRLAEVWRRAKVTFHAAEVGDGTDARLWVTLHDQMVQASVALADWVTGKGKEFENEG